MTDFIEVRTALPSKENANKIAHHLVSLRLAASAQVFGPIASTYWWKGKMTNAQEWVVTAKTRRALYQETEQAIRHLHPYEEPGIIAIPMPTGSASYFSWIAKETNMESQQGTLTNEIGLKEQLIQAFDEAYEKLIATVTQAEKQRDKAQNNTWGPREILGHIAGWAAQATAFIPQVIAGLPPQTYASDFQHQTIDDAFNIAFIALLENQTFEQVLSLAHQTHQCFIQMLREQPETIFIPGNYVYERMKRIIAHHLEHTEELETLNTENHC